MTVRRRRWALGLGVVVTLLLVWFAPQDEAPVARSSLAARKQMAAPTAAAPRADGPAAPGTAPAVMRPEQLAHGARAPVADAADLFKVTSWFVPPPPPSSPPPAPPPPPPPPPPKPVAPALPFTFLGQIIEDQNVQVVLSRGERVFVVGVGENIDKNYRFEGMRRGTLIFVYLPLDTTQTLATGLTQ